jgi:uroporphyrinogen decarboxylase
MPMTSRERVLKAIEFGCPDRIPLFKGPDADIAGVGCAPATNFAPREPGMDEWGCVRTSLNKEAGDQGQVTEHPLSDWSAFDSYTFPDPFAPGRFADAKERVGSLHQAGMFVIGFIGKGPMHLLDDLRGFEAYLMDLMCEPARIEALLDGIFRFLHGVTEQFGELGADAVMLFDDQAMQSGPLFSMDLWREHLKPRYTRLCALAHNKGCRVIMHACGELSQHLPELAQAGVDVVDNKQPALWMSSDAVDKIRGKLAFSTCLDIQSVMPTIDPESIESQVHTLVHRLATPKGGCIATHYHQTDLDIDPEKNTRMLEAFKSFAWNRDDGCQEANAGTGGNA